MARDVGSFNQGHVLGYTKVHEVVGFAQNEHVPCHRGLYLSEFLAEVFNENLLQTSAGFHRLLPDDFEALIEPGKDVF
jgi:hypothetical protein